jgi:hypothetical protein
VSDTLETAARTARAVGFLVAVKALAPELPHTERLGWIRLELADPAAVTAAASEVMAAARSCGLDPRADDLAAVVRVVEGIARAAADLRGGLASLEANPLIARSRGAAAVDALAEARPPA